MSSTALTQQSLSETSLCSESLHDALPESQDGVTKPYARRWEHRYSAENLAQSPSPLKESASSLDTSNVIPLGTGRPAAQYYPWDSMAMHATPASMKSVMSSRSLNMTCTRGEANFDLSGVLDYGLPSGSPKLIGYFEEHVKAIRSPLYKDWEVSLTCGTTAALEIVLRMFCNRGDWILAEKFTYAGMTTAVRTQGLNVLGVEMDQDGLLPSDLDAKLEGWNEARGPKPFVLYMIPSGQNPTGITQSTERKRAIYRVAEKHDLYIIEDDPYYFLHLGGSSKEYSSNTDCNISTEEYAKKLPTSYLSLDVSGRVLRLDSASKVLAPGLRFGWVTASAQIIDMYVCTAEISSLSPSGPSQVMVYKLLSETWGHHGFMSWLNYLSSQYRQRRDDLLAACSRHLPSNICRWNAPEAGMFLWLRIDLSYHPSCGQSGWLNSIEDHQDIESRLHQKAQEHGVMVAMGSWFALETEKREMFFRMTYVAASKSELEQAILRFSQVLRAEFNF
ncbi:hypothetical protein NW762_008927 [Fusarium torreyae]|uniref:Aminotransferase class I/classII large domain-containing protein n=1 Tax=Fusarium torreyae TaxID=1237075 RepID=A0A9W8VEX4_9HYPO|nr:hypothetical protein NW762_008927 [Fusarium torreyae]